jgi:hypothetical protein
MRWRVLLGINRDVLLAVSCWIDNLIILSLACCLMACNIGVPPPLLPSWINKDCLVVSLSSCSNKHPTTAGDACRSSAMESGVAVKNNRLCNKCGHGHQRCCLLHYVQCFVSVVEVGPSISCRVARPFHYEE